MAKKHRVSSEDMSKIRKQSFSSNAIGNVNGSGVAQDKQNPSKH